MSWPDRVLPEQIAASAAGLQDDLTADRVTSRGFLLLNSSMMPIFVNPLAAQILMYPQKVEIHVDLNADLASKIRSILVRERSEHGPVFVPHFQSGKRVYLCRAFRVNALSQAGSQPSVAVLLERGPKGSVSLDHVSEKFHLSIREREVLQHLLEAGPTTKEIAIQMGISPHTVKAFLRLIMVKMGVSTRSGIVGKALYQRTPLAAPEAQRLAQPSKPKLGKAI